MNSVWIIETLLKINKSKTNTIVYDFVRTNQEIYGTRHVNGGNVVCEDYLFKCFKPIAQYNV